MDTSDEEIPANDNEFTEMAQPVPYVIPVTDDRSGLRNRRSDDDKPESRKRDSEDIHLPDDVIAFLCQKPYNMAAPYSIGDTPK